MTINEEMLMAYADGQLSPAEAAEVEKAMADDEAIAARVAVFADSRKEMQRAFGTAAPVPDALADQIRAMARADAMERGSRAEVAKIVTLADRRRTVPFWQLPLAASVALGLGFLGGWLGAPEDGAASGFQIADLDDPALVSALGRMRSGERLAVGDGELAVIASFRDGDGVLCREFEHDAAGGRTVVAVACHEGDAWEIGFAVTAAAADAGGYAPASSLEALDAWLNATEAGAPLSDDEEAAALAELR